MTDVNTLMEKLDKMASDSAELSDEERKEIREILRAWHLWKSMGVIGRVMIWFLMTAAAVAVAWDQIKTGVSKWLG